MGLIDWILIAVLLICAITDIKERKIYNKVLFPAMLLAFIFHGAVSGWEGLFHSFLGFLIGFALLFIPYAMGGMGAGDVKLLALVGALKGGTFVLQSFIFIALLGALMGLIVLLRNKNILKSFFYKLTHIKSGTRAPGGLSRQSLSKTYPYGVAIALGAAVNLFTEGMLF
ncbi:A24 family peptidase [Marinococcus luteus]|uniref:A24 family peptidase n=1 Tax=Marinococcus luteus TaxID=1122204 RepID=UPI002ACCB9AE|nr:prepilin peptidase [Marinococcus luteus]MDZ5783472.1 prepilin peptidase [Marinococcus luteus]